MSKTKVVNFYAGPGTGKSTTCAALFAELKYQNHNVEMVLEYAKEGAWEGRGKKFFQAQDYIHGHQHFRMSTVAEEVELIITDSPLLLGLVYMPKDYPQPSLGKQIREAYNRYDNLNIFLRRNKPYNPKGRNQTEDEAKVLDQQILNMLLEQHVPFIELSFGRENIPQTIKILKEKGWIK